jgi:two-component system, OmpR family, sensor histidine kinase QseC
VKGHAVLLELALRNLVENALSHTPGGTLVEVEIDPQAGCLQVCDDAAAPRPSGRALGLGLGHRVVDKVAAIHGAAFEVEDADPKGRRCYRIRFASMSA